MAGGGWIRISAMEAHLDAHTINNEIRDILNRKAKSVTNDPDLRQLIGTYYVNAVTPFVPAKSGTLRRSGRATSDGRVYWTATRVSKDGSSSYNYANIQFAPEDFGKVYRNYTTPGTGPHWTDKVQPGTPEWDEFIEKITPHILRRFADG